MRSLNKLIAKNLKLQTIDGKVHEGFVLTREAAATLEIDVSDNPFNSRYFFQTRDGDYIDLSAHGHAKVFMPSAKNPPKRLKKRQLSSHGYAGVAMPSRDILYQKINNHDIPLGFNEVVDSYPSQYALMYWTVGAQKKAMALVNINSPAYALFEERMRKITAQTPAILYSEEKPAGFVIERNGLIGKM